MELRILLPTVEDTNALGARLAGLLFPGSSVALIGPLGAGKTTLVRALAIGLGVESRVISSPTFALVHEYIGHWPVYHFDAYRLAGVQEFLALGADEYLSGCGVCLVEWADRVIAALPEDHLRIELAHVGEHRQAAVSATGPDHRRVVNALS